ncbi:unnamed protein product, partial [Timema podura]|nr:unnamed protein product [Timema podura]
MIGNSPTYTGRAGASSNVDVTLCNQEAIEIVKNWKVLDGLKISDHKLITFEIEGDLGLQAELGKQTSCCRAGARINPGTIRSRSGGTPSVAGYQERRIPGADHLLIRKADQLLPYYVMELSEHVPGLPGLFVAGVFSAALRARVALQTSFRLETGAEFYVPNSDARCVNSSNFEAAMFRPGSWVVMTYLLSYIRDGIGHIHLVKREEVDSTGLNSMTGVIFEDLIRPMYKGPISESTASLIMKIVVAIIGTCCVGLVFLVDKLGTIVQAVKSLTGIASGSLLGIFSLGMFFPWANPK